mgnify:CR=1 FL=1|jgi:integrase
MGSLRKKTATKPLPANAELFERKGQQFARWIDGRGRKKTAPTTIGKDSSTRIVVESGKWLAKYRDGCGLLQEVSTGCKDKGAAQAVLSQLERRQELIRSGVVTSAEEGIADHAGTPIRQHFEAYHEHRVTQELNEARIKSTQSRLKRLANECGFKRLADLSGELLTRWLGQQLAAGMGAGTRNEYRAEMISFANWCVRSGRLAVNPFGDVPRANAKADRRRKRRALAETELEQLLYVARWRPLAEYGRKTIRPEAMAESKRSNWSKAPLTYDSLEAVVTRALERLTDNSTFAAKLDHRGRERALVYRTLVLTGLRRGELASLTVGSLELDAATPYAVLAAGDEKNGQGSEIPLRADLVVELREWVAEKRASFTGSDSEFSNLPLFAVPASLLKVLNRDLKAAGIPKTDERGRTVDVHAMRMTLATMLNRAGVAPRTAQEIMRHSDIRLTMSTYTDAKLLNVSGALDSLPKLTPDEKSDEKRDSMRATGTTGSVAPKFPPLFPPDAGVRGETVSIPVILAGNFGAERSDNGERENRTKPTKKSLSEGNSDKPSGVGMTGFEPATSASRKQLPTQKPNVL